MDEVLLLNWAKEEVTKCLLVIEDCIKTTCHRDVYAEFMGGTKAICVALTVPELKAFTERLERYKRKNIYYQNHHLGKIFQGVPMIDFATCVHSLKNGDETDLEAIAYYQKHIVPSTDNLGWMIYWNIRYSDNDLYIKQRTSFFFVVTGPVPKDIQTEFDQEFSKVEMMRFRKYLASKGFQLQFTPTSAKCKEVIQLVSGTCAQCLRKRTGTQFNKCANCKFIHYCSRECQKKDWTKHKKVCTISMCVGKKVMLQALMSQ
jgi:hypothetical protein